MAEKKQLNVREKLMAIQTEMKAPKNLYNSFGKYNYRNAEGILETLKPFLKKHNCSCVIEDDIVVLGSNPNEVAQTNSGVVASDNTRFYIKATVTFVDNETGDAITTSAFARESMDKKGMDASQVTGATSSYARKYALNGMFLLDDTKDADTDEYQNERNAKAQKNAPKAKNESNTSSGNKWNVN